MNTEGAKNFRTTHWSIVLQAGDGGDSCSAAALEHLCAAYWYPLYGYLRRRGYDPHEAQDLTQEFFAQLLQRRFLDAVGPEKGKFRSFLLAAMNNFLANQPLGANMEMASAKSGLGSAGNRAGTGHLEHCSHFHDRGLSLAAGASDHRAHQCPVGAPRPQSRMAKSRGTGRGGQDE
ncbi:MAG: hypothetical protein L0Z50_09400 [Verrucomicrobiales bacterium]|nr:hypothetical protein [Verrucomicrobiales bacterium]